MEAHRLITPDGTFLRIQWSVWKVVGWIGNAVFFSRFLVQWYATEKRKQVVVPALFWWLSLGGSLVLLSYAVHRRDSVFIFAYAFTWIPYIRNLIIHHRHERSRRPCPECGVLSFPAASFCGQCGSQTNSINGRRRKMNRRRGQRLFFNARTGVFQHQLGRAEFMPIKQAERMRAGREANRRGYFRAGMGEIVVDDMRFVQPHFSAGVALEEKRVVAVRRNSDETFEAHACFATRRQGTQIQSATFSG